MQPAIFITTILVGGLTLGALARLFVPGSRRLTWAEITLAGIAGAGLGALVANLLTPDAATTVLRPATVAGGVAGTVLVLTVVVTVIDRFDLRPDLSRRLTVAELIKAGESRDVEFKQTARRNVHTGARDPKIELAITKAIAGFLNAAGGTLLVGVTDDRTAVGLDDDLALMKGPDLDRYQLWLTDHVERCLGGTAMAQVRITFEPVDDRQVCRVDVVPAPDPVFLDEPGGARGADLYVRTGNSTRKLLTDDAVDYCRNRWP